MQTFHSFRLQMGLLIALSVLLLPIGSLATNHSLDANQIWIGTIETAGLWGSMQLKLTQQGDTWKGESIFKIAGNEQTRPIGEFKASGSEISFSTDVQVFDRLHISLRFTGKRYENELRGSFAAIRSDGIVTSGTWDLQSQESNQPAETISALPAPTGRYAIGRTSFHWRDSSRQEVMTDDPKDFREIMVHVWYPAEHSLTASAAAFLPDLELYKTFYPESRLAILGALRSHAVTDAAIASGRNPFPVVILSQGGGVSAYFHSAVIEELVSQGYIVAAIDHTYEGQPVLFPNKRIVSYNESQLKNVKDVLRFNRERIEVRATDASFVIGQLGKLNASSKVFRGRIDLQRIGIFGHSRGGLTAPMACQRDGRFKACLNMDGGFLGGPFYPDAVPKQPFMWFVRFKDEPSDGQLNDWKMTRQQWDQNRDRIYSRVNGYFQKIISGSYRVTLNGAVHLTFSDVPLFQPQIDLETLAFRFRMVRIVRNYTLAFFDKHLKNEKSELLNGAASDYPEVRVERFEPRLVH